MNNKLFYLILLSVYAISRIKLVDSIYLFDDTFITFRYAENFANSNGLVYNLSENFLGVSTPIYALFCSLLAFLKVDLTLFISYFNIAFELISIHLLIKYLKLNSKVLNILIVVMISVSPYLLRVTLGGMEANLFFLSSIISIILFTNKKYYLMTLITSVTCFIRPEGIVLISILIVLLLIKKEYKLILKLIPIGTIVASIGLTIIYLNYGVLLPQSVSAKAGLSDIGIIDVLNAIFWRDKVTLVLILPSVYVFIKYKDNLFLNIISFWAFGMLMFYLITKPLVWTWYVYPIWFIISMLGVIGLYELVKKYTISENLKYLIILPILFSVFISNYKVNLVSKNIYGELEIYFKNFPKNKYTIYANDIGAIGYYSKQFIYDSESLISDKAMLLNRKEDLVNIYKPDYLFINNTNENFKILEQELKNYNFVRAFMQSGDSAFPKMHSETWVQDYLLFKRK